MLCIFSVICNHEIFVKLNLPLLLVLVRQREKSRKDFDLLAFKYRVSQKKYPLLTGNRNETIRYHYSPSGQLNLSIFNLDPHTLHLKIGHQTLEIQACKVKIYSAPETRGFVKGPSHDLLSQACCTEISTLTFSFLH